MKLRAELVRQHDGKLPPTAWLPRGYSLELASDAERCHLCGGRLRRVRTSDRQPMGLMLGQPRVRLVHKACADCGQAEEDFYHDLVPPDGNHAFDLIVEVGLARLRHLRQDAEICDDLQRRWGLTLSSSAVGGLVDSFLDGLAAVHQAHTAQLREQLERDGGYVLHQDGTCEPGTDVVYAAMAAPRQWILETCKMTGENKASIGELITHTVAHFGMPLAMMRDLSRNIEQAKEETFPEVPDLICHYHFLENVGNKLYAKLHPKLTAALRRVKTRAMLKRTRADLVRWTKRGTPVTSKQVEQLLLHPDGGAGLDSLTLRRVVAYVSLKWLDDYESDLRGEYFPFDLPSLALYRRGRALLELLEVTLPAEDVPREFSTFQTIMRHLSPLRDDSELVAAAERLEKAETLFEEFRCVLRLEQTPREPLLRGHELIESREEVEEVAVGLREWENALRERLHHEPDADKRMDQQIVLHYLETYRGKLFGHVIFLDGCDEPFVVARTNNALEQRFGAAKQGIRRRVGTKKLTRHIQAMRGEQMLVANLEDPLYLELVCGGDLATLPTEMSRHWELARGIRQARRQPKADHPIPVTTRMLRRPELLPNLRRLLETSLSLGVKPAA